MRIGTIIKSVRRDERQRKIISKYTDKSRYIPHEIYKRLKAIKNCQVCGCRINKPEIHHKVPISKGGENIQDNLLALCHDCHKRLDKGDIPI